MVRVACLLIVFSSLVVGVAGCSRASGVVDASKEERDAYRDQKAADQDAMKVPEGTPDSEI